MTKKIKVHIRNNHWKEELKTIDISKYQDIISNGAKVEISKHREAIGTWKSELAHEVRMREKYENLKNSENMECPTCDQDIDKAFVQTKYDEHHDRAMYCSEEIKKVVYAFPCPSNSVCSGPKPGCFTAPANVASYCKIGIP